MEAALTFLKPAYFFFKDYILIVADILIVSYILYRGYLLIAGTRAVQILLGLLVILLIAILSKFLKLTTLNWLLKNLSSYIFIGVIILFQPELRRILSQVGQNRFLLNVLDKEGVAIDEIVNAMRNMSKEKVGSLIVIEREMGLKNYIETGTKIEALISEELIRNIFQYKSPLHDGAVIISNNKVASAACYLPLSDSKQLKKVHGARHRAGLGIAEESDAVVLISSEETGTLSIAAEGKLYYNVDHKDLKNLILKFLNPRPVPGVVKG
jgi:diadenylate cyclase